MIFIDETDQWHGASLSSAVMEKIRSQGCLGATVLRGTSGFGAHGQIHTAAIVDLSIGLPVIIVVVDETERIQRLLPLLKEMIQEGLIVVDEVESILLSAQPAAGKAAEMKHVHAPHTVSEYMNRQPLTITTQLTFSDIVKELIEHHLSYLPVVNDRGVLLGVVASQDLLARIVSVPHGGMHFFGLRGDATHQARSDFKSLSASDLMHPRPIAVTEDTLMSKAVATMLREKIGMLPVVSEGRLIGTLTLPDVIQQALAIDDVT